MRLEFNKRRISHEEILDHPARWLEDDLDADRYSSEEYGFLLGYYGDDLEA